MEISPHPLHTSLLFYHTQLDNPDQVLSMKKKLQTLCFPTLSTLELISLALYCLSPVEPSRIEKDLRIEGL